jgi:hypothetical protein
MMAYQTALWQFKKGGSLGQSYRFSVCHLHQLHLASVFGFSLIRALSLRHPDLFIRLGFVLRSWPRIFRAILSLVRQGQLEAVPLLFGRIFRGGRFLPGFGLGLAGAIFRHLFRH